MSNRELFEYIRDNYEFDQLILEGYHDSDPRSGWVHVSWDTDGGNRNMAFRIDFQQEYTPTILGL